jgi:hypothetical protein
VRLLTSVCALAAACACSSSPTAPTRNVDLATQLSWRVLSTSSSCAATALPWPQPEFSAAAIRQQPDGAVVASWPYVVNGRQMTLHTRFVRENGTWAMCSWDTADA